MSEPQKVARLDLSTTSPAPDAVPTSFSEAPSKQTKRLHQLKPSAKIDLTTHGPVRPEPSEAPKSAAKPKQKASRAQGDQGGGHKRRGGPPSGKTHAGGHPGGRRRGGDGRPGGRSQSAPSSGSTLAELLSADVLAKLRGD